MTLRGEEIALHTIGNVCRGERLEVVVSPDNGGEKHNRRFNNVKRGYGIAIASLIFDCSGRGLISPR